MAEHPTQRGVPAPTIAVFVTPHGLGHAARSAAVLAELQRLRPCLRAEIFTTVPTWLFADSLPGPFAVHALACDVGLVQRGALNEDPSATRRALAALLPEEPGRLDELVRRLAADLRRLGCGVVLADIAPLGLAAAREAGLPAVLLENFTWDWIYRAYLDEEPGLAPFAARLAAWCGEADLRLQAEPCCAPAAGAVAIGLVRRPPRRDRAATRRDLGVEAARKLVLITMGGSAWEPSFLAALEHSRLAEFVVPGGAAEPCRRGSLVLLPEHARHYHPDLVAAADVVVAKAGYSTLAEACAAGVGYLCIDRPRFPEAPVLAAYLERHVPFRSIAASQLTDGSWLAELADLLATPRRAPVPAPGARQAAAAISQLLG